MTISGKSTDKPTADDCHVSVIVNGVKPYQPATANGTTGENDDYSRWFFILNSNYTSIKEGVNKITAKLSCIPTIMGADNNMTKWYSINVTGITTRNDTTAATIPPQSLPDVNLSAQIEPNNKDGRRPLEPQVNEEQEASIFDSNNNNDKKIREEIENLRERIMERAKKKYLYKCGIVKGLEGGGIYGPLHSSGLVGLVPTSVLKVGSYFDRREVKLYVFSRFSYFCQWLFSLHNSSG